MIPSRPTRKKEDQDWEDRDLEMEMGRMILVEMEELGGWRIREVKLVLERKRV